MAVREHILSRMDDRDADLTLPSRKVQPEGTET